jgi:hypothetical protein
MLITPLEPIENIKKKMKKFSYASLEGTFIKYSSPFGVGHAYIVSYSKSDIDYNIPLKVETLYEHILNFDKTDSSFSVFKELVIKGNYHIIGKISFIYKDDNGFNDLLVISCNDLTFFVDKKDFKNVCVKLGDWVEFNISSLEFYCME